MQEIPIPLVRANQSVIVLGSVAAIFLQQTALLAGLFLLLLLPLLFGPKANIIFLLTKPIVRKKIQGAETEARELQRFNQTIAVIMLGTALLILLATGHWIGWIIVGMVALAATMAILGFCIGCILYFQLKQWRYKMRGHN